MVGAWPAQGSPLYVASLVAASALAAFFAAAGLVTAGSMMADVADEHELATGRRQEGLLFGAQSFAAKSASGIGHQIAGIGLDAIAFPAGAAVGAVGPTQVLGLGLLAGPGVGMLAVVAIALLAGYRLDRARHAEITRALDERRRAAPPETLAAPALTPVDPLRAPP
jgi:Na+/melibiose symporter-like transporter